MGQQQKQLGSNPEKSLIIGLCSAIFKVSMIAVPFLENKGTHPLGKRDKLKRAGRYLNNRGTTGEQPGIDLEKNYNFAYKLIDFVK